MEKKKLLKLAWVTAVIGLVVLLLAYFCFHYVTDAGITLEWHAEAGKPFVTILIGVFGVFKSSYSVIDRRTVFKPFTIFQCAHKNAIIFIYIPLIAKIKMQSSR